MEVLSFLFSVSELQTSCPPASGDTGMNTHVRHLDANERTGRQISVGVFIMGNNPHFTKCARDEMKTAVIAAAGWCVNVEAVAIELKVDKD